MVRRNEVDPESRVQREGAAAEALDEAAWLRAFEDEGTTRRIAHEPRHDRSGSAQADAGSVALSPGAAWPSRARTWFAAGTMVGHHEVIRPLGQGGMGAVFLARDTRLGRRVALKFLLTIDPHRMARFLVEARATAQLVHENIVALYDIAEHEGLPYMVLEHVQGKSLSAWLRGRAETERANLSPARAAELMLPVARALVCAHATGIVHRDLKPANIMLADSGAVKVLDFGIAKLLGDATARFGMQDADEVHMRPATREQGASATATLAHSVAHEAKDPRGIAPPPPAPAALTETGALLGTQAYMAPEQWLAEPVDGRADLWAVGVMLYELVTGEHPLAPLTPMSILGVAQRDEPMPSVRERLPDIGKLGAIIDRCLLKRKEDRITSAEQLCEELEAIARPRAIALRGEPEGDPYAGLAAFQERDAERFFGRDAMIEQVVARLAEQPLLAIVGSSGAGKSSLVRAGVIPALKRGGDAWETFVIRPGPRPLTALAELLSQHAWLRSSQSHDASPSSASEPPSLMGDRDAVGERLRREPGFLGVQMRARARRRLEQMLLFVDQFEEVYTLAAEHEREAFLACLAGAADDASSPLRVIVAIRHDFLDRVAGSPSAFADLVGRGTVLVSPLDRRGLLCALTRPVEAEDYRFESPALVDEMLDALAHTAGALPLLQFTAAKLWEARDRERRRITEASYRAFGGVIGALASHADSVFAGLSSAERSCARALLLRLVTPDRTRDIVTRSELSDLVGVPAAELDRVLGRLIDARLVTASGAARDESMVELVHESLITAWPALARWLEEEQGDARFRDRLRAAAKEWEASGAAEGLLWRGDAAEEVRRFRERLGDGAAAGLSAREARYLAAVVTLGERERRLRRRLVSATIAGLCAIVVLVSALAVRANREAARAEEQSARAEQQAGRADTEREEAARSAARARNAGRMAAARERQEDPTLVLALLRELEPGPLPRGWAELARWAHDTGAAEVVFSHDGDINAVAFSPDGRSIVSASHDKTLRVWNADGSGQPLVLRGHDDAVYAAGWSPEGRRIVSASGDKTIRIWDAAGLGQPLVLRGHGEEVVTAAFSPDGQRILSASYDKTIRIWDARGSGEPVVLRGHDDRIHMAAWSHDGRRIVSASYDKTVRVWNADGSGKPVVLRGHDEEVVAVAFGPDGRRIVSASSDKTVRVWDADGAGDPLVLQGHGDGVYAAAFSPDGGRIASGSGDKTVHVRNADGSGSTLVLRGHTSWVNAVAWSPDGRRLVSASGDKTARVWNADGSGRTLFLRGHGGEVFAASWSPDGRSVVSASGDKTLRVWRADGTGTPIELHGHKELVQSASWSPDGLRIVSASWDRTVRIWNADGSGDPIVLRGHEAAIYGASWSPDGLRIVSASWDKTVRIWNADGKGKPMVLRGHDGRVTDAAFSPDGLRIVSASWDETVRIWNADGTGEPMVLRGHEDGVTGVAWSPDGQRIVSASGDKTVRIWNADGAGEPLVLRGHEASAGVRGAPFSPDGARVVSHSDDATVRIWRTDGAGAPLVLRPANVPVNSAAWSPDGTRIVASLSDGTIAVWSDMEPLLGAEDPKIWRATRYCLPLDARLRLLDFPEAQALADLARCERHVREHRGIGANGL